MGERWKGYGGEMRERWELGEKVDKNVEKIRRTLGTQWRNGRREKQNWGGRSFPRHSLEEAQTGKEVHLERWGERSGRLKPPRN